MKVIKRFARRLARLFLLLLLISITILAIGLFIPQPELSAGKSYQSLIIKNVSIIDVNNGEILSDRHILVNGKKIESITSKTVDHGPSVLVVDGSGRFIMPGLWDMHAHFIHHSPKIHFPLLIAHGVTHVREMGFGSPMGEESGESILMSLSDRDRWRQEIAKGNLIGPNIDSSAVYQVEEFGDVWENDDEIPDFETTFKLFKKLKKDGVDFIKITLENNPPKEFFYRIMKAANQAEIDVVGHKPRRISAVEAAELGMKSFEHARFLVVESSALRGTYLNGSFKGKGTPNQLYRQMIDGYDYKLAQDTFSAFNANGSWYCPTHITRRWEANYDNEEYRSDERIKYIPFLLRSI
ncbi:MAG: hypothetical protein OQJ89_15200, partial [Kangiellaceae bacterium]|nr:hypothetical protein [Kangiellaceae bacterium]